MTHVTINPELLTWARKRAGFDLENLRNRFPKLESWELGERMPTLKQLEAFARAVFVPIGYFFLVKPPKEEIPIPDLRTIGSEISKPASPDLLDVLYLCQRRQAWYRDYARSIAEEPRSFVGSMNVNYSVEGTAETIRKTLGFDLETRRSCPTWTEALRKFIEKCEDLGVLVMVSGVVGCNNRRKLDPKEFRGFAMADKYAPLIFINGSDTKAAQIFTLAHELAHIWIGESALSNADPASRHSQKIEIWCNSIAAEILVPINILRECLPPRNPLDAVQDLARRFKVSTLVILRRIMDAGAISRKIFQNVYAKELDRLRDLSKSSGGNFYLTQEARASRRFVQALVISTLEGQTLFRDAFQLLGIKKKKTFMEFGTRMGVIL